MEFLLSGRSALVVFLLSCAVLGAVRVVEAPVRTRTVTEIVSVMQLPERPRPAEASPPPEPGQAAAPVHEEPRRVVVAISRPRPAPHAIPKPRAVQVAHAPEVKPAPPAAVKAVVAQAGPPVPRMFVPLRRLGLDIHARLIRAGVVPYCSDAQCDADGATR